MDSARDKVTRKIVDAEQLWDMEIVNKDGYECPGCGIQVFPASYKKDINKKRPYFTPLDNKHIEPCGINGVEKLVIKARKSKVGTPEGFPLPFPNRLNFNEECLVNTNGGIPRIPQRHEYARLRSNNKPITKYHGHTVKTIRPICRIFMDFPYDRTQLPLEILGYYGSTYAEVFRRLKFCEFKAQQPSTGIFYAALRWSFPAETDTYIEWVLDAGVWPRGEKHPTQFYKIRVMWNGWTKNQRKALKNEIEICRNQVKGENDKNMKAWLFFLARQDIDDVTLFVVDRYPLICCRVGKMTWPYYQ